MTVLATTTARPALRVLACATVALAPLEGYLTDVHPQLAKVAPALLVLVWLTVRVRERRGPQGHPVHVLLAALAVLILASSALNAGGPFTAEYTGRWLPFLALTVVLIDVAAREAGVRALIAAAVAGATVAGAGAVYSLLAGGATRATGPLEDPNDLAFVLVMAVPLLVAVRRGPLVAVAALVLVGGAAATFSRGGALALTAAVLWLLVRRALPLRVLGLAFAGVAVAVVVATQVAGPALSKALGEKSFIAESNVDTRELRWQAAARMLAGHPVLGVGPGGFRAGYAAASHNAEIDEQTPVAHNMFLEVAAELGLPAFAVFAGLVAAGLVAAERVARSGGDRDAMVAIQASTFAVAVASTFLSEQYYLPLWLLVALAVAADLRHANERSRDAGAPRHQ
jgi:hypothetical protein